MHYDYRETTPRIMLELSELSSAQEWCQKVARHVLHVARAEYCMRRGVAGCYGVVVSVTLITALDL